MNTTAYKSILSDLNIRSSRFRYRHTLGAAAAASGGIPATWIWAWLLNKRLKSQTWLRKVWVRLEDVQELVADPQAIREAVYATGEHLASPTAIQHNVEQSPDAANREFLPATEPSWLPTSDVLTGMEAR
jgi:hypothetical protein